MKGPKPGMFVYLRENDSELSRAVALVEGLRSHFLG